MKRLCGFCNCASKVTFTGLACRLNLKNSAYTQKLKLDRSVSLGEVDLSDPISFLVSLSGAFERSSHLYYPVFPNS
jgi:hypothetical protein